MKLFYDVCYTLNSSNYVLYYSAVSISIPSPMAQSSSTKLIKNSSAVPSLGNISSGTTFKYGGMKDDCFLCPLATGGGAGAPLDGACGGTGAETGAATLGV